MRRDTELVRFDACPDDPFRPTSTPIYQTATFEQASALDFGRYDYTRSGNPTRSQLAEAIAELEHGAGAVVTSTGMSAVGLVLALARPGDVVVAAHDCYGGTQRDRKSVV